MKKLLLLLFTTAILLCSCEKMQNATAIQSKQTTQLLMESQKQIGMPAIINFQEKKLFKQIIELRDKEDVITYCYLFNSMTGTVGQFLGKGIGYGIPAATQYTNPQKVTDIGYGIEHEKVLPQSDPNGLFMPTQTSATWYMLLDNEGNPRPVYIEPEIIVSPIPLK